ncbi:hypothetical protein [Kordiimonas pumila]|uniref:Uncharacterized protein n=1 Tax=Kordiimonas pumila TaxID=2161677 RepID=A0ABV7D173_9PROT|nr:hypothetical protein [Kordiimonas pumila]
MTVEHIAALTMFILIGAAGLALLQDAFMCLYSQFRKAPRAHRQPSITDTAHISYRALNIK